MTAAQAHENGPDAEQEYGGDGKRYGFGLTTFVAGLILIPLSVLGFAALVGIGAMAITMLTSLALARRRSSETNP